MSNVAMMDVKNTVITAQVVITGLIKILESEGLEPKEMRVLIGEEHLPKELIKEVPFQKLMDLAMTNLENLQQENLEIVFKEPTPEMIEKEMVGKVIPSFVGSEEQAKNEFKEKYKKMIELGKVK